MWACRRLLLIPPRKVLLGRPPHLFLRRRRYASDDASDTPSTEVRKKRYLYVVLEDTHAWFAIHKLDIHGDHGDKKNNNTPKRLPNPPVMRLESFPTLGYLPWFAFVGNNVIGIGSAISKLFDERDGFTMALDVKTMSLTLQRDLPLGLENHYPHLAVATGNNRLYVLQHSPRIAAHTLETPSDKGAMHCLMFNDGPPGSKPPQDEDSWWWRDDSDSWLWCWTNRYHYGSCLPLSPEGITSHAVHPHAADGAVIFVSVHCKKIVDHRGRGTFSYDTKRDLWSRHGDWQLPFGGQAHYDSDFGVWIGLHLHRGDYGTTSMDGYLCSCDIPPLDHPDPAPAPQWKLVRQEKLFLHDPARHINAKLVSMGGGGGQFCLLEILTREGVHRDECLGDDDKCVLRLTTFWVKYDHDGELAITARRHAGSYNISRYNASMFDAPQASWM